MIQRKAHATFIPFRRRDIIQMCLRDGKLNDEQKQEFETLCKILTAFYHFSFHSVLERLKDYFIPTDPDKPFKTVFPEENKNEEEQVNQFFDDFESLLIKANFHAIDEEEVNRSFGDKSLINLSVKVDFEQFERCLIYSRGSKEMTAPIRHLYFWKKNITFEVYERVILLIKFKDRRYFEEKKIQLDTLNFHPGRTYIFYFKNVPKADLEIIFPNVRISMTTKDKLLFLLPCVGVGLSTLFKIWGQLFIIIGFVIFLVGLRTWAQKFNFNEEMIQTSLLPLWAAVSTVLIVLGGFAIKQYMTYKNKWVQFLNDVTQTLFFRSVGVNAGVFQNLIDSAEEEECKEAILAYYHLLISERPLTKEELDAKVEDWFKEKFDTELDFDVEDALHKLTRIRGMIAIKREAKPCMEERVLVNQDDQGRLNVESLEKSIMVLDSIWDNLFQYHGAKILDP